MWKRRTSLFAACLKRDSLFHLLSCCQLQYFKSWGYKEISWSQTLKPKSECIGPLWRHMGENGFSCTTFALPEHPRTFHEIFRSHCGFSCPCELRWDHDLKVCGSQDKAALFIQLKKNTVLHSEGLQVWAPCQRWPRNLVFGKMSLSGFGLH